MRPAPSAPWGLRSGCTWDTLPRQMQLAHTQPAGLHLPLPGWQAEGGTRHRQMSWGSGKGKKETGNWSDRPQQAKRASATDSRLSWYFFLCLKPPELCTGKKPRTIAPNIRERPAENNTAFIHSSFNSTCTKGLYCAMQ